MTTSSPRYTPTELMALAAVLAAALVVRVVMLLVTPAYQAPDESCHVHYVRHLVEHHNLPKLPPRSLDMWKKPDCQAYQPPLAYAAFLPAYRIATSLGATPEQIAKVVRAQNALYGVLLVLVGYWTATLLTPVADPRRWVTAILLAFVPGFVAVTASVNNDGMACLMAAVVWLLMLGGRPTARQSILLGIAFGLACLMKLTNLVLAPMVLLVPLLLHGVKPLAAARQTVIVGAVATAVMAPWLAHNWTVYGHPLPVDSGSLSFAWLKTVLPSEVVDPSAKPRPDKAFLQFWGRAGIYNNLSWTWIPGLFIPLTAAAFVGWIRRKPRDTLDALDAAAPALAVGLMFAAAGLVSFSLRYYGGWQGRYLYPAMVPASLLLAGGIARLLSGRAMIRFTWLLAIGLFVMNLVFDYRLHVFYSTHAENLRGLATRL